MYITDILHKISIITEKNYKNETKQKETEHLEIQPHPSQTNTPREVW